MPHGSVLGPILFVLYSIDLIQMVESHGLSPHLYADNVQVYSSCSPAAVDALSAKISDCVSDIADWARSNRLMLNPDKYEAIWCTSGVSINYQPLQYRSLASQSLRRGPSVIWAFTLMHTCRCGRTSNERRRAASLLSANCARSAERCRLPHSRCS